MMIRKKKRSTFTCFDQRIKKKRKKKNIANSIPYRILLIVRKMC